MATNTCGSLLEQVQKGHRHPQIHHTLILTSLLARDNGGGQHCKGNREGNSPVREVFTVFLPDLLRLLPQHTHPSFQKKLYTLQHPFLIFKPFTTLVLSNLHPSSPLFSWRHTAGHPLPAQHQISSPCFQDQQPDRLYLPRLTVFSIFPLACSSAYKRKYT